jgi:hypothetical protein
MCYGGNFIKPMEDTTTLMRNKRRRLLRNQRRVGETITIASGIGVALLGSFLGVQFVSYGGLCIAGLGIVSVFWR